MCKFLMGIGRKATDASSRQVLLHSTQPLKIGRKGEWESKGVGKLLYWAHSVLSVAIYGPNKHKQETYIVCKSVQSSRQGSPS